MGDLGKQFGDIVRQRLDALETNAYSIEKAHHLPPDAIRNIIRSQKKSGPTLSRVQEVCNALGLEISIGEPRELPSASQPPGIDEAQFANIPLHAVAPSAGGGRENGSEEIIDFLAFRRDWLRKIGVAPSNAVLARVEGESMQPSIWEKDLVLIDKSRTEIPVRKSIGETKHRSPVYALLEDGVACVKRIERPSENQIVLLSDNPNYGPQFIGVESLSLIGKVMWWGHTVRD